MEKLSLENRALVERFMDAGCYRPTDTTFGFTDRRLNELLNAARHEGAMDMERQVEEAAPPERIRPISEFARVEA